MIPANLAGWALQHGIPAAALHDLSRILGMDLVDAPTIVAPTGSDESWVQGRIRLDAARLGWRLHRNNVGALLDSRGVPVRYGLANDTAKLNSKLKSSDLIGWRPVTIDHRHLGVTIAQFVSVECKKPGWSWSGTDREVAQARWIQLVTVDGGLATFSTGQLPT